MDDFEALPPRHAADSQLLRELYNPRRNTTRWNQKWTTKKTLRRSASNLTAPERAGEIAGADITHSPTTLNLAHNSHCNGIAQLVKQGKPLPRDTVSTA